MGRREELLRTEAEGFDALARITESISAEQQEAVVNETGWTIRDLLWHLTYWCEDTTRVLGEIEAGTFDRGREPDGAAEVDPINDAELERSRALTFDEVRLAWLRGRARMLDAFAALETITPEADEWFAETGPLHYAEHLPEALAAFGEPRPSS